MDFWAVIKVVLRRWYVALPVVLVAGFVALQAARSIEPRYTADASLILVSPNAPNPLVEEAGPTNPYTSFNSSLNITANVVARIVDGPSLRRQLEARGLLPDYGIDMEQNSPIVLFSAEDADERLVLATLEGVIEEYGSQLQTLQDEEGVAAGDRIQMRVINPPVEATRLDGDANRVLLVILGLGAAAGVALAIIVEVVTAWRRRADGGKEPAPAPAPERDVTEWQRTTLGPPPGEPPRRLAAGRSSAPPGTKVS